MMAEFPASYFCIKAFSETDMTERAVLGIHRIKSVSGSIKCIWSTLA
jgi:hypothetical protein